MIGTTIGGYRITDQIGAGGMATVFKAYDATMDRYVALKLLPQQYYNDERFRKRFEREARAIAKLEHIHILPIFAYGEDSGHMFMAMRLMETGSLSDVLRDRGAMPHPTIARLIRQVGSALDYAHSQGILHRDIKPGNVLVDAENNAYLTDFGIAKIVEDVSALTQSGGIVGTPAYMAPEQCMGSTDIGPAADQYALGIILYEMLTGRVPFTAETPMAVVLKQMHDPLPLPSQFRGDLPESIEKVLLKALSKNPNQRFESCGELAGAFENAIAGEPVELATPDSTAVVASGEATHQMNPPLTAEETRANRQELPPAGPTRAARSRRRLNPVVAGGGALGVITALVIAVLFATGVLGGDDDGSPAQIAPVAVVATGETGCQPGETELYTENFDDGSAGGWEALEQGQPGWSIVTDEDGNRFLELTPGADWDVLDGYTFDQAVWRFEFAFVGAEVMTHFNWRTSPGLDDRYIVAFNSADMNVFPGTSRYTIFNDYPITDAAPYAPAPNEWHTLEIATSGNVVSVFMDGDLIMEGDDPDPFDGGSIGFEPFGGMTANPEPERAIWIDNITVCGLSAEQANFEDPTGLPSPRFVVPCKWHNDGDGLCILNENYDVVSTILEEWSSDEIGHAVWSPAGDEIAASYEGHVYRMNPDGGGLVMISPEDGHAADPAWDPRSEWVYMHWNGSLARARPDGSDFEIIIPNDTPGEETCIGWAQWSPDGDWMAVPMYGGDCAADNTTTPWRVEMRGHEGEYITTLRDEYIYGGAECSEEVAVSPDGGLIAVRRPDCQVDFMSTETGEVETLEGDFPYDWYPNRFEDEPVSSDEPAQAAGLVALRCDDLRNETGLICIIDKSIEQITPIGDPGWVMAGLPSWSPDGERLAFAAEPSGLFVGEGQLFTIRRDGSDLQEVTTSGSADFAVWSPDGSRIAMMYNNYAMTVAPDGSDAATLLDANRHGCLRQLAWHPSGDMLAISLGLDESCRTDTVETALWLIGTEAGAGDANIIREFNDLPGMTGTPLDTCEGIVAFSPDGDMVAIERPDCAAHIIVLESGELLETRDVIPAEWLHNNYPLPWQTEGESNSSAGDVLFGDDFESGDRFGWEGAGWALVDIDEGYAIRGIGIGMPDEPFFDSAAWGDYALEFDTLCEPSDTEDYELVALLQNDAGDIYNVHLRGMTDIGQSEYKIAQPSGVNLYYTSTENGRPQFDPGIWQHVRYEFRGDSIRALLNNIELYDTGIDDLSTMHLYGFEVPTGTCYLDGILIENLPR